MILGFLGKGGSGKSTVATQMALWLRASGRRVLAIDADHNMDLSHNLSNGQMPSIKYLGESLADVLAYASEMPNGRYQNIFLAGQPKQFTLSPLDTFTTDYSQELDSGIRIMAAGPQTDQVLYGLSCSHILTTALKVYLPLLSLVPEETVVVDEKAGADGVTTGIVTGFDVGVIVVEPALHSIKTAKQIAGLMDFYRTPYLFVANKVTNEEDIEFLKSAGIRPVTILSFAADLQRAPHLLCGLWRESLQKICEEARKLSRNDRLERTREKFKRNADFDHVHAHGD